jgi:4-hydroxy-tetrahydrodipicolinate synthase
MQADLLKGIIVPTLTPINDEEKIDVKGFKKLIRYLVKERMNGIFLFGTTGEYVRVCNSQAQIAIEAVMSEANSLIPVYMGVSDCGYKKVLEKVRVAEKFCCDAIVISLPYYFSVTNTEEQFLFFDSILKSTDLPVILYNMPLAVGANINIEVIERLLDRGNIIGIKDSSGDIGYLKQILTIKPDNNFKILVGDEGIAAEGLFSGADGLVPSLANIFPKLLLNLYNACCNYDRSLANFLQSKVNDINILNNCCESELASIIFKKKALSIMGICSEKAMEPCLKLSVDMQNEIRDCVEREIDLDSLQI